MRACRWCGNPIRPKPTHRGIETPSATAARKFCARHCWREWKRDGAERTSPVRLMEMQRAVEESRRFQAGDPVWYERSLEETYGWPARVPAVVVEYLNDFGRSRVLIRVQRSRGLDTRVTTQERKLTPRAEPIEDLRRELAEKRGEDMRLCEQCNLPIDKYWRSGRIIPLCRYEALKFCGRECAAIASRGKARRRAA